MGHEGHATIVLTVQRHVTEAHCKGHTKKKKNTHNSLGWFALIAVDRCGWGVRVYTTVKQMM